MSLALFPANGKTGDIIYDSDGFILGISPRSGFVIRDTFITANTDLGSALGWRSLVSGTDSGISEGSFVTAGNVMGQMQMTSGTTTTGRARYILDTTSMLLSTALIKNEWRFTVNDLSTSAEEFSVIMGIIDGADAPSNGVFISYDRATDGDNFFLYSVNSSTTTKEDLGIAPVADTFNSVGFEVNADATSIQGIVDGAVVGSAITTDIPTIDLGPDIQILKSAGTTSRVINVSDFYMHVVYTDLAY